MSKRKFTIVGEIHQRGLTYKDKGVAVLADPNNNIFHKVEITGEIEAGEAVPITKVAGMFAHNCCVWASNVKGLQKRAGFLVDFNIEFSELANNEANLIEGAEAVEVVPPTVITCKISNRLQLSQPSDVAAYAMQTLLAALSPANSEGYSTGEFLETKDAVLLVERLKLNPIFAKMPPHLQNLMLNEKRKLIKGNLRKEKHQLLVDMGKIKPKVEEVVSEVVA